MGLIYSVLGVQSWMRTNAQTLRQTAHPLVRKRRATHCLTHCLAHCLIDPVNLSMLNIDLLGLRLPLYLVSRIGVLRYSS